MEQIKGKTNTKIIQPAFFYIIEFDGQIHEIRFSQEGFNKTFELWRKKGLIIFRGFKGVAGANVKKVLLGGDEYKNYIAMTRPATYVLNGYIKDGKTHDVIRVLKWKQDELDAMKKLKAPENEVLTDEQREHAKKKMAEIFADLKNKNIVKSMPE